VLRLHLQTGLSAVSYLHVLAPGYYRHSGGAAGAAEGDAMMTPTHCVCCDRPADGFAAIVIDVSGHNRLSLGLCPRCMEAHGGGYSDEVSDAIHARFAENPHKYFAYPMRMGRLQ
jgi:hypothetical protein